MHDELVKFRLKKKKRKEKTPGKVYHDFVFQDFPL